MSIFGIAKRGFGMLKKKKAGKGKEWDILKKHPTLAKQSYSKSAVNKMLSKDRKKPKTMDDLMDKVSEDYIKYRKKKK